VLQLMIGGVIRLFYKPLERDGEQPFSYYLNDSNEANPNVTIEINMDRVQLIPKSAAVLLVLEDTQIRNSTSRTQS